VIAYKLRQTYLIELEKVSVFDAIIRNSEKFLYERMVTRLHLRANDVNLGPVSVNETKIKSGF